MHIKSNFKKKAIQAYDQGNEEHATGYHHGKRMILHDQNDIIKTLISCS